MSVNQIKMPSETFDCVLSHIVVKSLYEHKSKIKNANTWRKTMAELRRYVERCYGLDDPYILFISIMILINLLQSINYVVLITIFFQF